MKFKKYLNEEVKLPNIDVALEFIKKNCKPYLNDWYKTGLWKRQEPLYTGRKNNPDITLRKVRKNRNPLDTPDEIHDLFNDTLEDKFGIPLRSESIFCSGKYSFATNYGTAYFIFPIKKYEIYWHEQIEDLFTDIYDSYDYMEFEYGDFRWNDEDGYDLIMSKYKKGNLYDAIRSQNEVMMVTDSVVLISKNQFANDVYLMMERSHGKF